jgi:hypothetical protein
MEPRHRTRRGQAFGAELPEFSSSRKREFSLARGVAPLRSDLAIEPRHRRRRAQAFGAELPEFSSSRKREFSLVSRAPPLRTRPFPPSRRDGNEAAHRATDAARDSLLEESLPEFWFSGKTRIL